MKKAPVMHDERPDRGWCKKVPLAVCAVAYDRCFTALSYRVSQKKWCIAISNSCVVLDDQRLIKLTDT